MQKIAFSALFFVSLFLALFLGRNSITNFKNYLLQNKCDNPIHYRVDVLDQRFKLSKDKFLKDIDKATLIWENVTHKNLFIYDPQGLLSINLVFDERQSLNNQILKLQDDLTDNQKALNPQIVEYKRLAQEFKKKLDELNEKIAYWNSQGGAPADAYSELVRQQDELKNQSDYLNNLAKDLNQSTDIYNSQVTKLQKTVDNFKQTLNEKPEEGVYKQGENIIEVYFNIDENELVHTLAHELGHALELEHNTNPISIMYPNTNKSLSASAEEISEISQICSQNILLEKIKENFFYLSSKYLPI